MDTVVYALLNKKIRGLVSGIQSASVSGTTITFTMNDGSKQSITFPAPKDGLSITDIDVNADNTLTCTLSDGSTVTTTNKIKTIKGDPGEKGENGKSAYDLAKDNGFTGTETEYLASLKGDSFTYDDFTPEQLSALKGADGVSPIITENINNTDDIYRLDITTDTGTIITPNLKGGGSGGSEVFDRTDLTAVTVGGLNSGSSVKNKTTKEVLESILFPYQKPTVSFSISPNTTVYESGTAASSIKFTISATKKSDIIQSIKVYDGSTLLTTITSGVASGGTFTYTYSCNITTNTTLKVEVSDGTSTVSATKNITFANKSYYGFVANGTTVNETVIKALQNNVLKTSKALNYTGINCVDSKIVYAYPKSQGLLSSVLDGSGFDYIDSYDCLTMTVNGEDYYVYVMIDPTTLDDFIQKFA